MKVAEVLQDERLQLMPMPKPFDGYVEQPARVSSTSLIHFQKNRYSVPTPCAHRASTQPSWSSSPITKRLPCTSVCSSDTSPSTTGSTTSR